MKYAIFLDDREIETFFGSEEEAVIKYEEYKESYKGEEVYDKLELCAFRTVKEESL